jgi:hypothetical protein
MSLVLDSSTSLLLGNPAKYCAGRPIISFSCDIWFLGLPSSVTTWSVRSSSSHTTLAKMTFSTFLGGTRAILKGGLEHKSIKLVLPVLISRIDWTRNVGRLAHS